MPSPTAFQQRLAERLREEAAAARRAAGYVTDPASWANDRLGRHLWSKQQEILASVRDNRLTAVKSAHGTGKSATAGMATGWSIDTHPLGRWRVITTAPTGDQVRAVLWAEINGMAAAAEDRGQPLPGRINEVEWKYRNQVIALGRKPADHNKHGMQGLHGRDGVLVVLDEACGIPEQIWTAAMAIASNDDSRILAIGNPDDPGSYFARVCKPGSGWNVITISAFDTPFYTGEECPPDLIRSLTGPLYVDQVTREYGEHSPVYISKVLGEFPDDSQSGVIRLSELARCRHERLFPRTPAELLPVELGVDVAEGVGADEAVIQERRGVMVGRNWRSREWDTVELTARVLAAITTTGATRVKIDSAGIGAGVVHQLRDKQRHGAAPGVQIIGVNVGMTSSKPARFTRIRSEIWWDVGRALTEAGGWDFSNREWVTDADWDRLVTQLCAPKYDLDASDRIVVEQKEDTKKRLGRSPDNADALLLAFYNPPGTSGFFDALVQQNAATGGPSSAPTSR